VEVAPRLLVALGFALALVLGGCAPPSEEPGLFRVRSPSPSPALPLDDDPLPTTSPSVSDVEPVLPVAGEVVRTTGEGAEVTVRFAVHALRRITGATVLDFSVTPLRAPGLQDGDELPSETDLGIDRVDGGSLRAWLLDPVTGRGYPPLAHSSRRAYHHCLCTPLWSVRSQMRMGETRLLQAAFPALPSRVRHVDVLFAGLPVVPHVPVTPSGQVPKPKRPVDLARVAEKPAPVGQPVVVGSLTGETRQAYSLTLERVLASRGSTSVQWSIRTITGGLDVRYDPLDPPLGSVVPEEVEVTTERAVSGLTLRAAPDGPSLPALWLTTDVFGRPAYECLCSDLGLWARSLDRSGGTVHGTSLHAPLPPGTDRVELRWPGLKPVTLPVEAAPDAADRLGPPTDRQVRTWVYSDDVPPQGWRAAEWPTPLPDPWQLPDYRAMVEDVTELPSR